MRKRIIAFSVLAVLIFSAFPVLALGASAAETLDYGETTTNESDVLHVYDKLKAGVDKDAPDEKISFDNARSISKSEMEKGIALFISDHPECFWFRNYYSYQPVGEKVLSITPKYSFTGNELIEARAELDNVVNGIMNGLPTTSNYDKALYLHDALAKIVVYEQVGEHQTAYGALVSGKAVCAGYAAAYQLLLEEAGIVAWTVTGQSRGIPHAWNLVWLDADTCVYTDVTWDDQTDEIFHYYFNLSKSEMAVDHTVDADKFSLPECTHNTDSYFDISGGEMDDSTTVEEIVDLFGPAIDGGRSAKLYYTGSDFAAWMNANGYDLYVALGGNRYVASSYSRTMLGKEIHLTVKGKFADETYIVNVSAGINVSAYVDTLQYVAKGEAMEPIIFTAKVGYYFPEDYSVSSKGGISVTRIDATHIRVSGTPTYDGINLTLPEPAKMTLEQTPEASFTATSEASGILSGIGAGMRYSYDGENWTDITSSDDLRLEGVTEGSIYIVKRGNGESTYDSAMQIIEISRAQTPSLEVVQPSSVGAKGRINTTNAHEYSTDGLEWIACEGALENVDAGRYYVRVRANGSILASEAQEITVVAYTDSSQSSDGEQNGNNGGASSQKPSGSQNAGSYGDNDADYTDGADRGDREDPLQSLVPCSCKMSFESEGAALIAALLALTFILCLKKRREN